MRRVRFGNCTVVVDFAGTNYCTDLRDGAAFCYYCYYIEVMARNSETLMKFAVAAYEFLEADTSSSDEELEILGHILPVVRKPKIANFLEIIDQYSEEEVSIIIITEVHCVLVFIYYYLNN